MTREASHSTIPGLDPGISPSVSLAVESPLQDEVRGLIADLNAVLLETTPVEFCYHLTAEEMAAPNTTVFVARIAGRAIGVGALRCHAGGVGEVKRMYVRPDRQGRGIGGMILAAIEALAVKEGLSRLVLETGINQPAAQRLYERSGFSRSGPVLGYPLTPYSVFFEKGLARRASSAA